MVDTEDIAVKANQLAPGRFCWRKYRDQINIENVRTFLSDAKKPKNGQLLVGSGKEGWMLTEKGFKFAKDRIDELEATDLTRVRQTSEEKKWTAREKSRILLTPAYEKFIKGDPESITVQEAETLFRIDDYVREKARERRILRILNAFSDDDHVGKAVLYLSEKVKKGA